MKFIYLMGMPYSGTTLLSRLVSMHQEIATVGEMINVVHMAARGSYLCACGKKLAECPFWLGIKTRMASQGQDLNLSDFRIRPPKRLAGIVYKGAQVASNAGVACKHLRDIANTFSTYKARSSLTARVRAFSKSVVEQSGKSIFFDASKDPNLLFYLAGGNCFQPYFVHMVRDPRGVAVSMMKNLSRGSFENCISEWLSTNKKIAYLLSLFPQVKTVTIQYEDLCASPSKVLEKFCQSIGAEGDKYRIITETESHIIGNRMRLANLKNIKLDESWQRILSDRDREVARKIAGPFAQRFGYAL